MQWTARMDAGRDVGLRGLFDYVVRERGLPCGEVTCAEELHGCAIWMPPGTWQTRLSLREYARLLPRIVRLTSVWRVSRFLRTIDLLDKHHPTTPHYYLAFVGVDPRAQGRGVGRALLRATTDRLDRDGIPAYLENSNPQNARLYESLGFRATGAFVPASGAPRLVTMWREPASHA